MAVAVSTVTSLGDALQELLDAGLAALATTGKGVPDIHYVSAGVPPADFGCDQLIAFANLIGEEATQPGSPTPAPGRRHGRGRVNLPTMNLMVARCWSVKPPISEASIPGLNADGLAHAEDGWALWNGVTAAIRDNTLFGGRCDDIHFDGLRALDPKGGLYGWILTLRPSLDGIPAA